MKKKKIITGLAEFRIRLSRGLGVVYDFRQAMVFGAAAQIILKLSIFWAIVATLGAYLGFYILGSLKVIEDLAKKMNELTTSKYNPHLAKISRITEKLK